jgi:hypothetical protein
MSKPLPLGARTVKGVAQPKSQIRTFLNSALLSIPDSKLTVINEDIWENFNDNEIIVKYGKEKSILASIPNSVRFRPKFTTGREFFVRTNSYNSWKALEPARKAAALAKDLDYLMGTFEEYLGSTNSNKYFDADNFQKLVKYGRINEEDYLKSEGDIEDGINREKILVTHYTRKTTGGFRKRYRKTHRRSTKHRKTKRRSYKKTAPSRG